MNSATKVQKTENKTAIYCRISTSMQSTDRQKEDLLKVAERFKYEIDADHIYIDIITGFSIGEERPNYSALLNEVEKGKTETAFRNFETAFLRAEVPLVNAETGPLPEKCQKFSPYSRRREPQARFWLYGTQKKAVHPGGHTAKREL
jgi:hypothetical protein